MSILICQQERVTLLKGEQ